MNVLEYHQECLKDPYKSENHKYIVSFLTNNKLDLHFNAIEAWKKYCHTCDGFGIMAYNEAAFMEYAAECRPVELKAQ